MPSWHTTPVFLRKLVTICFLIFMFFGPNKIQILHNLHEKCPPLFIASQNIKRGKFQRMDKMNLSLKEFKNDFVQMFQLFTVLKPFSIKSNEGFGTSPRSHLLIIRK